MQQTGAILGGESSGGLTVRNHINGKDGVYAAMLLVEMLAVTNKKISEIQEMIQEEYGAIHMEEKGYQFSQERKDEIYHVLMEEKLLPSMNYPIKNVSYLDGCKVYFENGGWIIARFSGTEPLLRIFCEMPEEKDAVISSAKCRNKKMLSSYVRHLKNFCSCNEGWEDGTMSIRG